MVHPGGPPKYYAERGAWVSWEDFLGTPRPPGNPRRVRAFKAYADAKRYMREVRRERRDGPTRGRVLDLRGAAAGHVLRVQALGVLRRSAAGHPRDPAAVYGKRGEWVSWDDFLGRAPGTAKRGPKPKKARTRSSPDESERFFFSEKRGVYSSARSGRGRPRRARSFVEEEIGGRRAIVFVAVVASCRMSDKTLKRNVA